MEAYKYRLTKFSEQIRNLSLDMPNSITLTSNNITHLIMTYN